jgi:hypothetical protein
MSSFRTIFLAFFTNSPLCRPEGLATATRLSGFVQARGIAFTAAAVDFHHCRENSKSPASPPTATPWLARHPPRTRALADKSNNVNRVRPGCKSTLPLFSATIPSKATPAMPRLEHVRRPQTDCASQAKACIQNKRKDFLDQKICKIIVMVVRAVRFIMRFLQPIPDAPYRDPKTPPCCVVLIGTICHAGTGPGVSTQRCNAIGCAIRGLRMVWIHLRLFSFSGMSSQVLCGPSRGNGVEAY